MLQLDTELDVATRSDVPITEDGDGIATTNEKGFTDLCCPKEEMQSLMLIREARFLLPRTASDGIAATNEKGVVEPLSNEGIDARVVVATSSQVPIIEDGDGIAVTNSEKGVDEALLTEGREVELIANAESKVLEYQCGSDDNDSSLAIEEGSDADGKEAHMAKNVDEINMCAWSDDEVVAEEVVATPIQQPVPIDII